MDQEASWEFRRHVLPVLARAGCNMGACHGALAGKGGFKLSLRGYYPEGDFQAIAREARGRRIELSDPGRSLLLAKPTGAVPHKGGLRLELAIARITASCPNGSRRVPRPPRSTTLFWSEFKWSRRRCG